MKNKIKKAHCAVDYAFQRIGGKYITILIDAFIIYFNLYYLKFLQIKVFNTFAASTYNKVCYILKT